MKHLTIFLLSIFISTFIFSQEKKDADSMGIKQYSVIDYDLYNGTVDDFLPFDVPFFLRGAVSNNVSKIELFYIEQRKLKVETKYDNSTETKSSQTGTSNNDYSITTTNGNKNRNRIYISYNNNNKKNVYVVKFGMNGKIHTHKSNENKLPEEKKIKEKEIIKIKKPRTCYKHEVKDTFTVYTDKCAMIFTFVNVTTTGKSDFKVSIQKFTKQNYYSLDIGANDKKSTKIISAINSKRPDTLNQFQIEQLISGVRDKEWGYSSWTRSPKALKIDTTIRQPDTFNLFIEPLKPNKEYLFYAKINYNLKGIEGETVVQLFKDNITQNLKEFYYESIDYSIFKKVPKNKQTISDIVDTLYKNYNYNSYSALNSTKFSFLENKDPKTKESNALINLFLFPNVAVRIQNITLKQYGLKLDSSKLVTSLDKTFSNSDKTYFTHIQLSMVENTECAYRNNSYNLQNDDSLLNSNSLKNFLLKNCSAEFIDRYNELDKIRTHPNNSHNFNLGYYRKGEYVNIPKLESINDVKNFDTLIFNVNELKQQVKSIQKEIISFSKSDFFLKEMFPVDYPNLNDNKKSITDSIAKLKAIKERTEIQVKKLEELEEELVKNKTCFDTLYKEAEKIIQSKTSHYLDYTNKLIDSSLSSLHKLKHEQTLIDQFWNNLKTNLYFNIETSDGFKTAFQNSTTNSFMTRAEYYISGDIGLAGMCFGRMGSSNFGIKTIQPYFGVNFNLFPINRQAHYNLLMSQSRSKYKRNTVTYKSYLSNVFRGSSIVIGITWRDIGVDIYDNDDLVKPLYQTTNTMIMTGFALRISDYIRLTTGVHWYRYRSSYNPFDEQQFKLGGSLYFGLSADLNVKKYLGLLGDVIMKDTPRK